MNALDSLPPAKNSPLSGENETTDLRTSFAKNSPPPENAPGAPWRAGISRGEPFAALMSRALAKPSLSPREVAAHAPRGEHGENSYETEKSLSGLRSNRASKNEAGASRKSRPADRAKSPASEGSLSPPAQETSIHGAAKEKHGGVAADENPDSRDTEDKDNNDPAVAAGADSASGTAAAALQILTSSETAQITLPTGSIALDTSKIAGTGAVNNPGSTGGTRPVSISKTDETPDRADEVSGKMSKPGADKAAEARQEGSASAPDPAKKADSADGAAPIQALLDKVKMSKEPASIAANSASGKPQSPLSEAAGISAAQQVATMNNTDTAPKIAGDSQQSLPGLTVVASAQSAPREKPASGAVSRTESPEAAAAANSSAVDRTPAAVESSSSLISASSQTDLRVRALDRTHDIMALHGMRLKESNTDSLHVVIKPGAGLQLSLQLKQNGDGIEAHAVLQRGDFNQLNQHWKELQHRLEQRGIRLAPLDHENSPASTSNENFQHHPHQPAEQDSLSAGRFAEPAFAGSAAGSSVARRSQVAAQRGWESWA